ncbi:MAG: NAD(P)H-hydrate dehydratase [Actinobacteria bacterium]|nr:NAD(P)H-hydrate dehydratase [Actinomycetota bacterium]
MISNTIVAGKVYTGSQVLGADERAISSGVPSIELMENAGRSCVLSVKKIFGCLYGMRAAIFCGKGNNGGDGLVVARLLYGLGCEVRVLIISSDLDLKGDPQQNLARLRELGVKPLLFSNDKGLIAQELGNFSPDIVVDAIFGIGLSGEVQRLYRSAIDQINKLVADLKQKNSNGLPMVVSVDCPSGIGSNTGSVLGSAVKADMTITFSGYKYGLFNQPGASYAGRIVLTDVGVDEKFMPESNIFYTTSSRVRDSLKPRLQYGHKGDFGIILMVMGSCGMAGAVALAAKAAFLSGAGLVRVVLPSSIYSVVSTLAPEATYLPISGKNEKFLDHECIYRIMDEVSSSDVVLIGPGLGREKETGFLVRDLIKSIDKPFVLDADGIYALAENIDTILEKKAACVLTPHPGELSRLIGDKIPYDKRLEVNRNFAMNFRLVSVLKGSRTLITSEAGDTFINLTGNSGMATGGSGDVLAGLIASLIGQGNNLFVSAVAGAYLHGLSGDIAAEEKGMVSITALDILNFLGSAFLKICGKRRQENVR